jgi:cytochrome c-type biogenesis protein CcmF
VTYWQSAGGVVMTALGLLLAEWLLGSVLVEVAEPTLLLKQPGRLLSRARSLPRATWGMSLAHGGVAMILLGITVSEAWTIEDLRVMSPGDEAVVGDYMFRFHGVEPVAGPNYTAIRGHFDVFTGATQITSLDPEDRLYTDPVMNTTEAAIHPLPGGDLYAVIGEAAGGGRWSVRLYFKPFISGLWLGTAMMVIGGLLSLTDRRLRIGVPTGRRAKARQAAAQEA